MIRISVCYNNSNVKLCCSHAGVTVGEDGATAQCLEDLAIMRVLPNMRVLYPVDYIETCKAIRAAAKEFGPFYIRLSRSAVPGITEEADEFVIGKANVLKQGKDATVIACGLMVKEALDAAEMLAAENINVKIVNMHTIKPIDEAQIILSAKETGAIVTAEEHQINGGLGGAVAEVLARNYPVPVEMIAVNDSFGTSGKPEELLAKFHLKAVDIAAAVKKAISRKL
jgi:transketolase